MELPQQLLKEHSKENTSLIVNHIIENPELVKELMHIFLKREYRLVQRSAWVVGDLARQRPDWIYGYIPAMLENLKQPDVHDAAKRNTMRFLQEVDIDEEYWGDALDIAMKLLNAHDEAVAIKVFSMTVAFNIVKKIPELKEELQVSIEDQLPYGTAGFKSRGNKILRALEKL